MESCLENDVKLIEFYLTLNLDERSELMILTLFKNKIVLDKI